jgi:ferredoxin
MDLDPCTRCNACVAACPEGAIGLVGEFDKPRFFRDQQRLCAHSRNERIGCNACIEVCSTHAIRSDASAKGRPRTALQPAGGIVVEPHLCVGCGACTTVCPSGALGYAARLDAAIRGLPARVIPVPMWHTASVGIDPWLAAFAQGASQVWVLLTDEEAPEYRQALAEQMAIAQTLLQGLGYGVGHFRLIEARDARNPAALDAALRVPAACASTPPATVPDEALLAQFRVAVTQAPFAGGHLEAPWTDLVGALRATDAAGAAAEYDALFGGVGKPEVFLYGSYYLTGFLNEKPLAVLRHDLATLSLTRDADSAETQAFDMLE